MPGDQLVGVSEAAKILGLSVQRTDSLSKEDPDFPPVKSEARRGRRTWRQWERKAVERNWSADRKLPGGAQAIAAELRDKYGAQDHWHKDEYWSGRYLEFVIPSTHMHTSERHV